MTTPLRFNLTGKPEATILILLLLVISCLAAGAARTVAGITGFAECLWEQLSLAPGKLNKTPMTCGQLQ